LTPRLKSILRRAFLQLALFSVVTRILQLAV